MESAISLPFRFVNGRVAASYERPEIWKDRVFIALTTNLYERAMSPTYGTEIRKAIFEPGQMATEMVQSSIRTVFSTWLPALTLDEVLILPDPGDGSANISVKYTLPNAQQEVLAFKTATFNRYGETVRGL